MAFELLDNNLLGPAVIDRPANTLAGAATFIDPYDYAMQYQPELVPKLHMRYGKGSILGFCRITGSVDTYASDQIKHGEQNKLHTISKNVGVSGNVFTCPNGQPHNLRINDVITISDGVIQDQAIVTAVGSTLQFTALSDTSTSFTFAGNVTLFSSSNRFNKKEDDFTQGFTWSPEIITNYTHIIKEFYDVSDSDRAHDTWLMTPDGPMWFNYELAQTGRRYDNLCELTNVFHRRAIDGSSSELAGKAQGCKGVIQQVEERGNIANEYITSLDDLNDIAYRIKQQAGASVYTIWADHQQMYYFNQMLGGVNASLVNGANYGIFQNKPDMALHLDFTTVTMLGITFHITPWKVLDDPQFFGAEHFRATAPAYVMIPAGEKSVTDEGNTVSKPYLSLRYRRSSQTNRLKQVKLFGPGFTEHKKDSMEAHYTGEMTNQLVGANEWFVGRRNNYYTV